MTGAGKRTGGFAMISVLLVISIFFIITVAISTYVVLQARINYEASLTDMSYYLADAGLRVAQAKVMYRYFLRVNALGGGIYSTGYQVYGGDFDLSTTTRYKTSLQIDIYDLQPVAPTVDLYYTDINTIRCTARIYDTDNNSLVAQRSIFADIYLGDQMSNPAQIPGGIVKSVVKKYYELNR